MLQSELEDLKNKIEKLTKTDHIKIIIIMQKYKIALNENKNGFYINLSYVPLDALHELNDYILQFSQK